MIDNSDKLDDLFKSRFDEVELPVSDKLLTNIKQDLNASKRKRRFGFWIWLVCGLVVVAEIANISMPYFKKEKNEIANKIEVDKSTKVSVNNEMNDGDERKNENISNSVERKNDNEQNTHGASNAEERTITVVSTSTSTQQVKENTVTAQNKINTPAQPIAKTVQLDKRVGEKSEKKQSLKTTTSSTPKATKQDKSLDKEKNKEKSATTTSKKLSEDAIVAESKLQNTIINKDEQVESKNKSFAENSTALNTQASKYNLARADSVKNSSVSIVKEIIADTLVKNKDTVPVIVAKTEVDTTKIIPKEGSEKETETPKSFTFFVELNGGPSQSFRMLSPESNAVVKHRNASEKATLSYNASLDFGVLFKNKYQISTGLGIDTKAEQYHYKGHSAEYYTYLDSFYVYDTSYFIDSITFDTVPYIDSIFTEVLDSEQVKMAADEKRIKNRYQYVKIPLMLGYRFNINEKWFITPNVGVVVNYLISGNATWFDEANQQYITYNVRDDYRSVVFAARAKVDIGFNIKDRWSILLQPGYTRFLQSIYKTQNTFKHLPYSYDLNLGVRYTF
jgi:hypothetical protein